MDTLFEKEGKGFKPASDQNILLVASVVAKNKMATGKSIEDIKAAKEILIPMLANKPYEVFCVAFFDADGKLISFEELFKGTIDQVPAYPREVFRRAIELNALAVLLVHNHPSGNAEPSNADIMTTIKMRVVGDVMHVKLLDHWVVSGSQVYSLQEHGDLNSDKIRDMIEEQVMGGFGSRMIHKIELELDKDDNPLDKIKELMDGLIKGAKGKDKKLN